MFGQQVAFTVDGEGSRKSYLGLMLSICIFVAVIPYAFNKSETLRTYGDTILSDDIDPSGRKPS